MNKSCEHYLAVSTKSGNSDLFKAYLDGALQAYAMCGGVCPAETEYVRQTWIAGELLRYEMEVEASLRKNSRLLFSKHSKYDDSRPDFRDMLFGHGDANGDGGAANESSETLNHCVLHEIGSSLDHLCKCVDIIKDMLEPCEPSETIPPERK